jgi:hypothetical protein
MKSQRSTKRYARVTLADAQREFAERGLTLLAKQYVNVSTAMPYRCNVCNYSSKKGKGLRLNDLRRGVACRQCAISRRAAERAHSIDYVRDALAAVGITLLSKTYKNVETELRVRCSKCGHHWRATFHDLNPEQTDPTGCSPCSVKRRSNKLRLTTDYVRAELEKMGIVLLGKYHKADQPILVRYKKCGHTDPDRSWHAIQTREGRCAKCAPNATPTDEDYEAMAKEFNGRIVRKAATAGEDSEWICPIGHPFSRSYTTINSQRTFCNICTGSYSEILCRMLVESLFEAPFQPVRVKEMRSRKGAALELDMFNSDLRIAVEHNGPHHYGPVANWGGEAAFEIQRDNDSRRRKYCKENAILLIEICQLGQKTTLEQAKAQIQSALVEVGMLVPPSFETVDLSKLVPKSETQAYWELVQKAAANLGLKILPCVYEGADTPISVQCRVGHVRPKTPRSILQGRMCDECYSLRMKKPVRLSDGREFESGSAAAKVLGVSKETLNRAAREGRQVKGFYVQRIESNRTSSTGRAKS